MDTNSISVVPVLLWMVVATGTALISLLIWIGRRTDRKIEEIPKNVSIQVAKVHDEIVSQMQRMNDTHQRLESDMRAQGADIDRRVTRLEARCDMQHQRHQR